MTTYICTLDSWNIRVCTARTDDHQIGCYTRIVQSRSYKHHWLNRDDHSRRMYIRDNCNNHPRTFYNIRRWNWACKDKGHKPVRSGSHRFHSDCTDMAYILDNQSSRMNSFYNRALGKPVYIHICRYLQRSSRSNRICRNRKLSNKNENSIKRWSPSPVMK